MNELKDEKFKSDFCLTPLNINANSGPATWHPDTDPKVHDLLDGYREESVTYTRKKIYNNTYQDCKVVREDSKNIIMLPGDGSRYSVKRERTSNKINDKESASNDVACVVCLLYERNHAVIPCGHLVSCTRCALRLKQDDDRCPICRVPYNQLVKIFM
jgi:hypothetical protein